ncbi:MAG: hypothetical protein NZ733_03170 [Aigarchaeota archaeon]|nr:hypothetical protein [Aigarchaeota archaeon]MCS7127265.1 hypothetical protein [Candidatus Calditenuaceae archaeon]MDW8042720.1 hypothetical protein [Nitrososphaerota archaeon]
MVRIVEVRERDVREAPPPVDGEYELIAVDWEGVGYDLSDLLSQLEDEASRARTED